MEKHDMYTQNAFHIIESNSECPIIQPTYFTIIFSNWDLKKTSVNISKPWTETSSKIFHNILNRAKKKLNRKLEQKNKNYKKTM